MSTARNSATDRGFTLLEVLVVVIIIGIAGAMVVPQLLAAGSLTIQGAARLVVADLVYAQNEAVAAHRPHEVVFDIEDDGYSLRNADGVLPGSAHGGQYTVAFGAGGRFNNVRLEAVDFDGETTIGFDELGAPSNGGYVDITDGEHTFRIKVAPFTGRVTVAPAPDDSE